MPNIKQLISLKEKYSTLNVSENRVKQFINKSLVGSVALEKGFSFDRNRLLEHFSGVDETPDLINYFESYPEEDIVLLYIDIADFSKIIKDKTSKYVTNYLNNYYDEIIPIIYEYKGQVEKIMGDGIICVFGKPFLDSLDIIRYRNAEKCASVIIKRLKGTNKEVKIALHSGVITYYKIPGEYYEEYTMIGKPLTELYRLESVSKKNSINFFKGSEYDGYNPKNGFSLMTELNKDEIALYGFDVALRGVDYERVRYLKFI